MAQRALVVADRDGFKFRSGRLALDLPATLSGRLRAEPRDLLAGPGDLARWLVAAGLTTRLPEPSQRELVSARALREAIYRLALDGLQGRIYSSADRKLLNRWASEAPPAPQLGASGMSWTGREVTSLLAAVARDAVELLGGSLARRIRNCSGASCALLFVDTSRSGKRRWCSMAGCGNKAKVKNFRRRSRAAAR